MEKAYESGKEKDGFEFIDIRGQIQGHAALTHGTGGGFSGVAPTFGYEEDELPLRSSSKASRSRGFGGVAALFGDDDDDEGPPMAMPTVSKPPPKASRYKRRDPSFSGVTDLFCDAEEEEDEYVAPIRSAPMVRRAAPKKMSLKSKEMGGVYSAATRMNCRMQKKKMRARKGW